MTEYKNHYPYKVMLHNVYPIDNRQFDKWIRENRIIGWSWVHLPSERQTQYTFKNKEDAVLFKLTFG